MFWVDRKNPPTMADEDELFDIRAKYVWTRYDKDQMDRERGVFKPARLGSYDSMPAKASRISLIWKMRYAPIP